MSDGAPWLSFRDIVGAAATNIREIAMHEVPAGQLGVWASQSCADFARRTDSARQTARQVIVAGQRLYPLPADCSRVTRVAMFYPTDTAEEELPYLDQYETADSFSASIQSRPLSWSLSKDRKIVQLYPVPGVGGALDTTAGAGSASSLVLSSAASAVDDYYNGMVVRVLTGAQMSEEAQISDYVGSTRTATLATALSGAPGSGARVAIGIGETVSGQVNMALLRIDYVARGHAWRDQDVPGTVTAATPPNVLEFAHDAARPLNAFAGFEVFVTRGVCEGERALVTQSRLKASDTLKTLLTYAPEFMASQLDAGVGAQPATSDTFELRQVPNIDPSFHGAMIAFTTAMGLRLLKNPASEVHMADYERAIEECRAANEGPQDSEFEQVGEFGKGEEEDWWDE